MVQAKEDGATTAPNQSAGSKSSDWVQSVAAEGVRGSGGRLPYHDQIQASFGRHDVSAVQAFTGGQAGGAAKQIGAKAYATGNKVAFAGATDLHTAAHEAAHVVQQRAGVSLKGGVGQVGDKYEQHADAVADLVVQGKSAEGLLDQMAGNGAIEAVTQRVVQRDADDHNVVGDPALEHNAEKGAGDVNFDPEEDLFFNTFNEAGKWDGAAAAKMLSQVTGNASYTRFDQHRCGSVSALVPYVLAGPEAVVAVAASVNKKLAARVDALSKSEEEKVKGFDSKEQAVEHAKELLALVSQIPSEVAQKQMFIEHLSALSEGLFVVTAQDPVKGVNSAEVISMIGEGGGNAVFDLREGSGWGTIRELFTRVLPGQNNVAYPINLISKKGDDAHFVTAGADGSGAVYLHDSWPREGAQLLWFAGSEREIVEYFDSPDPERARTWEIAGSVRITI